MIWTAGQQSVRNAGPTYRWGIPSMGAWWMIPRFRQPGHVTVDVPRGVGLDGTVQEIDSSKNEAKHGRHVRT
jgi:hypothetical protein